MNSRRDQTWDNERWVIDRLIDAVEAGDGAEKVKYGKRLCEGQASLLWHAGRLVDVGNFMPFITLNTPLTENDVELFEMSDVVSEARLSALAAGARVSPEELHEWRCLRAKYDLEPGSGSVWAVMEVKQSGRRQCAYVAMTGRGPREADLELEVYVNCNDMQPRPRTRFDWLFVAAFSSYTEAVNALRTVGYTSIADYDRRSSADTDRP